MMSVLRLPSSMTQNAYSGPDMGAAAYRGPADGGHVDTYGKLRNCVQIWVLKKKKNINFSLLWIAASHKNLWYSNGIQSSLSDMNYFLLGISKANCYTVISRGYLQILYFGIYI